MLYNTARDTMVISLATLGVLLVIACTTFFIAYARACRHEKRR